MPCPHCGSQMEATRGTCPVCQTPVQPDTPSAPGTDPPTPALPDGSETEATCTAGTAIPGSDRPPGRPPDPDADDGPLTPGQAFGHRYRILGELGGGGMGVVYKAWDETLGLEVALKVIRPGVLADPRHALELERRFKRELVLARQVTHKNVVRIHDLGEIDGIKYITMSYVDGVDLATILHREGQMPVPRMLRLARRIVAGLKAAHEAGVVHRDLKPSNIMIDREDEPLIMDFGIARSAPADGDDSPPRGSASPPRRPRRHPETWDGATVPGAIVGTLEYMAPEQAGGREADQRADIYALGLILYDMLVGTGHHKARGRGLTALRERAHQAPLSPRELEPELPEALDHVVTRCLATDPADRYQSAGELDADLARLDEHGHPLPVAWRIGRRHVTAALLAALLAVVGTWWFARTPPPAVEPAPVSVLVADFDNRTGDAVFQGSLEQPLVIGIEAASFVTSYPRSTAQRLAEEITEGGTLDEAAARLVSIREDVKVVLAGSVDAEGSGYSISVRGIDPAAEEPLFTAEVSASGKDEVLGAVGTLAERIRRSLGDTHIEEDIEAGRETSFTAASLEAARSYTLAQDLADSYRDDEAITHYRQAAELDPNFGRAYAGWAYSAYRLGRTEESEAAWEKALALVDRMTEREKYRTLGLYFGTSSRNYDKAIENYQTLLSLYPADDTGHNNLAMSYFSTRRFDEALEEGRRALEIYPNRLLYRGNCALFAMYAGDFAAAEEEAAALVESDPDYYPAYLALAVGALARDDLAAAQKAYERLGETGMPGVSIAVHGLADLALYEGRSAEAAEILLPGITEDETAGNAFLQAAKEIAVAEALQGVGDEAAARDAVARALELRRRDETLLPAARVLLWADRPAEAADLARELDSQLEPQSRAFARIIEGEIAAREGRTVDALEAFQRAQALADPWLARFDLALLFVEAGRYAEALSELEICEKRRGEATALFLDDIPTYRYLAPLPYWLGRAQQGMGMTQAARESYDRYLALRPEATSDPLAADARQRREGLALTAP